jgi:hypothetical protein
MTGMNLELSFNIRVVNIFEIKERLRLYSIMTVTQELSGRS